MVLSVTQEILMTGTIHQTTASREFRVQRFRERGGADVTSAWSCVLAKQLRAGAGPAPRSRAGGELRSDPVGS